MQSRSRLKACLALGLAASVACPPVSALVSLNDGRDRIYVTGSVSVSQDSNIFANRDSQGDTVYSSALTADYTRRAGWIGVNGRVAVASSRFASFSSENFSNPSLSLEFNKQGGRTTGNLSLSAARESRADASVNVRSDSWNYGSDLEVKYPINGTNAVAGHFGFARRQYVDTTVFANLDTYSASLDLMRIMTTQRDLVAGYRYRHSQTSFNSTSDDHGFSLGVAGRLIASLKGSLRAGYQTRTSHIGATPLVAARSASFHGWTTAVSTTHAFTRKISLSAELAKDFSTSASDASVDALSGSLSLSYAHNSRWSLSGGATFGRSRFLGDAGRIVIAVGPPVVLGASREDIYLGLNAGLNYSLNEHFSSSFSYAWFRNWSTLSIADFDRGSWTLGATSRW